MAASSDGPSGSLLAVWIVITGLTAVLVGTGAGVLGWLSGQTPAGAVLTGGLAFGGTVTLVILIINALRGRS
jgi:hypothetical protein